MAKSRHGTWLPFRMNDQMKPVTCPTKLPVQQSDDLPILQIVNKRGRCTDPIDNSNSRMGFKPESSKDESA